MFLANPNNPTGSFLSRDQVAALHWGLPDNVLLVLDQAYGEYLAEEVDDGGLDLARNTKNVLVTRTFSKIYGLAGERIGWGTGDAEIIANLNRIRGPFNVTTKWTGSFDCGAGRSGFCCQIARSQCEGARKICRGDQRNGKFWTARGAKRSQFSIGSI